jgi:uncharacterized membrane protein
MLWLEFSSRYSFDGMYDWQVFFHVLAAMVWLGGITVLGAFALRILRADDSTAVGRFLGDLRRIGPLVLAPAPIALLGFGIWAALDSWDFGELWIQLGLGLFAAAFLVGAAHQSRAAIAAERAAKAGDHAAAAGWLRRWAWGMGVIVALLVVATWAMVAKPS